MKFCIRDLALLDFPTMDALLDLAGLGGRMGADIHWVGIYIEMRTCNDNNNYQKNPHKRQSPNILNKALRY